MEARLQRQGAEGLEELFCVSTKYGGSGAVAIKNPEDEDEREGGLLLVSLRGLGIDFKSQTTALNSEFMLLLCKVKDKQSCLSYFAHAAS